MSEELLVRHCSPTLAGMKTGSMFISTYETQVAMRESLRRFNRRLVKKGVRLVPLRYRNGKALIYVYRPERLRADLNRALAARILQERGYRCSTPQQCVRQLMKRLLREEFPHEIGLFLGYPPEDVRGFIENTRPCTCSGCWKVYGDAATAKKTFRKYKKCTAAYCRCLQNGTPLERLTVKRVS